MEKLGPAVLCELVFDLRQHRWSGPRDALHDSFRFATSQHRIEQKQLTDPSLMMASDDRRDFRRMIGHGAREEHGVRPVGICPRVFHLAAAVRIHGHEQAVPHVRRVSVIPPQVEDATVVEHARCVVVVLFESELPDVGAVRTHPVHHADDHTRIARYSLERRCRQEDNVVVRQVDRIVIVNVASCIGSDLPRGKPRRVGIRIQREFMDLPIALRVRHREEQSISIPMQFDVIDQTSARWPEECDRRLGRFPQRYDGDFIRPVVDVRHRAVIPGALPRYTKVFTVAKPFPVCPTCAAERDALDDQQRVEVQQWVCQQGRSPKIFPLRDRLFNRLPGFQTIRLMIM